MNLAQISVTVLGVAALGAVVWFFFGGRAKRVRVSGGKVAVEIMGGYEPSAIEIPVGQTTTISFHRSDPSSCLEEIVIPRLKFRRTISVGGTVSIEVAPDTPGEFPYSCGMNMYHGMIVAR